MPTSTLPYVWMTPSSEQVVKTGVAVRRSSKTSPVPKKRPLSRIQAAKSNSIFLAELLLEIDSLYEIRSKTKIVQFFVSNADLAQILIVLSQRISSIFPASGLALEYCPEKTAKNSPGSIRVLVKTEEDVSTASDKMDHLDEAFGTDLWCKTAGKILIDVEFI